MTSLAPDQQLAQLTDLLATIELYVNWRYVTHQLTTEQKILWADAIDSARPGRAERWWDWPSCTVCGNPVERGDDGLWRDLRRETEQYHQVNWAGRGLTPPHRHTAQPDGKQ